jgi:hypothetical protein
MAAPVNTVLPVISGTVAVGETLSVDNGTWTGSVASYSYQWQRVNSNTVNITGATLNTYVISSDDTDHEIQCVVTATSNQAESTSVTTLKTITVLGDWFIVEDGTAKTDAISLCSMEDANDYHAKRGNEAWAQIASGVRQSLLVQATDYLQQVYRMRWKGVRVSAEQALDFPRNFMEREDYEASTINGYQMLGGNYYYPSDNVPLEVINACAELAYKANSGELAPDLARATIREKVDVIEVEYDKSQPQYTKYRAIDNLLAPYLATGSSGSFRKVLRA